MIVKVCYYLHTIMLNQHPREIVFKIIREYIDYEEKVRLMNDPFFKNFLLTDYAWKTLPKIPLQHLHFISKHYLHVIASGFYVSKTDYYEVFKVFINKETGSVIIEGYEMASIFTASIKNHK